MVVAHVSLYQNKLCPSWEENTMTYDQYDIKFIMFSFNIPLFQISSGMDTYNFVFFYYKCLMVIT